MTSFDFLQNIDRRAFLRIASFTGIAGLIYPQKLISSFVNPTTLSRVVIVEDDTATNGNLIYKDTVQIMMDSGIKTLSQQSNIGEAWKSLLPGITQFKNIAIKVNCINSSLSTHPVVTDAVVNGLKQMDMDGTPFPENNIIIFDRFNNELRSGGYTLNTSGTGVRCFGTDTSGIGYSDQTYNIYGRNKKISKVITEMSDYLINLSVLKNHSTAGVTLCLKNHYGTCTLPENRLHNNHCDPYIPVLNAIDPIISKQRVNICDALLGIKFGGPSGNPQFRANKIIMSQDMVAVDYWGREILDENGSNTIYKAHHIDTAATEYSLGTNDPSQMKVEYIKNPTTSVSSLTDNINKPDGFLLQQNYPNPFNNHTEVRFYIAKPVAARLSIFDSTGRKVRRLVSKALPTGWHQVGWDGNNDSGKQVASGAYICQLQTGGFQKAIIMQLVK